MTRDWLNLPNRITIVRLIIAVALFILLSLQIYFDEGNRSKATILNLATVIFVVCVATDWLDGYLARRLGMVTAFGRIADPFVDKVVVVGTCIYLVRLAPDLIKPWFAVALAAREFLVTALRGFIESRGVPFGAQTAGKFKMILQSITLPMVMVYQANFHGADSASVFAPWSETVRLLAWAFVFATFLATLISAWGYIRAAAVALRLESENSAS